MNAQNEWSKRRCLKVPQDTVRLQVTKFKKYKSWHRKVKELCWAAFWLAVELMRERQSEGSSKQLLIKGQVLEGLKICTS